MAGLSCLSQQLIILIPYTRRRAGYHGKPSLVAKVVVIVIVIIVVMVVICPLGILIGVELFGITG